MNENESRVGGEALPDERAQFEATFQVPGWVQWNGSKYEVKEGWENSYVAERHGGRWEGWQARSALKQASDPTPALIEVTREDGNNYCRILTLLGMEEEGDPVAAVERLLASPQAGASDPTPEQAALGAEMLAYGNVRSLEEARAWADQAQREGLRGSYPSACVVLDMAYARLKAALAKGGSDE